jgi:tetratricopeptide (TPR) repeat protein
MKKLIFSLILIALLLPLRPARAQTGGGAEIRLQNVPIQDEKLLVVNVALVDIQDLYGAEIRLRYDPARLRVRDDNRRLEGVQISPGPLIDANDRFVVTNLANPETGQIDFIFTLLKPAAPITGEGVLATVVFEIAAPGPYPVEVTGAQLVSVELTAIPAAWHNLYLNDALEPVSPALLTAPQPANWLWLIGLAGVALAGGIGFMAWRRNLPAAEPPAALQPSGRPAPTSGRSNLRSAALLAEQGMRMLAQGEHQQADDLFSRAIEQDPANTQAWLGKGLLPQSSTEKYICLQRVLALDPKNQLALAELDKLKVAI